MSERKTARKTPETPKQEKRYKTSELLKSKFIRERYQRDFAKVILTKPAYSLSEAVEALDKTLKGGK